MMMRPLIALAVASTLASGCTTTGRGGAPVDVTRYHLSQPIPAGTVAVQPLATGTAGPEYRMYADAVAAQMAQMGFAAAPASATADYLATVGFSRTDRGFVRTPPPVTIGLGAGTGGGGVGIGGGGSIGIGSKTRAVYGNELSVQLRRRGDNTVIWEGRAVADSIEGQAGVQPADSANRMAAALFRGFPGQSGITITVK